MPFAAVDVDILAASSKRISCERTEPFLESRRERVHSDFPTLQPARGVIHPRPAKSETKDLYDCYEAT